MKHIAVIVVVAFAALTGEACAAPQACGYQPTLNFSDKSAAAKFLMQATDMGANSEMRACAYYALGTLYAFDGKNERAIENYQKALGWYATYADAYEGEGDAYAAMGQSDKAAAAYDKAASAGGDTPEGLADRCWTRAMRGAALDRAANDCTAALKNRPDHWQILLSRGLVNYRLGKFEAAIADCTAALGFRPRNADSLYVRGLSEIAKGDSQAGNADVAAAKGADYRIADTFALYGIKAP